MKQAIKTLIYVLAAVTVVLVAALTYPKQEAFELPDLVGKPLFENFADPAKAAELQILTFREDVGEFSEFEVARDLSTGLWVIPSSANYPADADVQMRDAATSLIDLKVLDVQSESAAEHETFGVIEPNRQMDRSQSGVGLLVTVKNEKGRDLAKLIIGKRAGERQPDGESGLRFVRRPGIDSTYVVKIDPEKFPTEFERWIEKDLLRLNELDVSRVQLKDYSVVKKQTPQGPRPTIQQRFKADVTWDADQNRWLLNGLAEFDQGEPRPAELLEIEELNDPRLNDLKAALSDMEIVGVMRKPAGLGADLRAGTEITNNPETALSLRSRGFYLDNRDRDHPELLAANGELVVGLNNGVQYLLRFGEIADVSPETEEGKLSRYLLVSVGLDQSKFPPLELEPLPGGKEVAEDASVADKLDLELQREKTRKENQRKKDPREEQLKEANQRISELNARFADWYYIIAEDEYRRVHLGRNDLVRESPMALEKGFGVDAFRWLQKGGLEGKVDAGPLPMSPFMRPGIER